MQQQELNSPKSQQLNEKTEDSLWIMVTFTSGGCQCWRGKKKFLKTSVEFLDISMYHSMHNRFMHIGGPFQDKCKQMPFFIIILNQLKIGKFNHLRMSS